MVKKIYYYYDPIVKKSEDDGHYRYSVDYFCTNGKKKVFAGRFNRNSPTAALKTVQEIVCALNQPRPLFGYKGKICQWFYWLKRN